MKDTRNLINQLSSEVTSSKQFPSPFYWSLRLLVIFVLYGLGAQALLGLREDIAIQFTRPLFVLEVALLLLLFISSTIISILAMYPDAYQKQGLFKLPYSLFILLIGLLTFQFFIPIDIPQTLPDTNTHNIECAICIASVALIPSALMFTLLRKGATIHPLQAGAFTVLATSAMSSLTLRLAEANDSLIHLVSWHYLPTLLFACLGAAIGKWLLKW